MRKSALISTFGSTGVSLLASLLVSVLIARNLGPEGRGALLAIMIWPAILAGIAGLSVNEATAYHVARGSVPGSTVEQNRYAGSGLVLQLLILLVATPTALALLPYMLTSERSSYIQDVTYFALLFLPFSLLDQHFKAVLQGQGALNVLSVVRFVQPAAYAVGVAVLVYLGWLTIRAVLVVQLLCMALSLVTAAAFAGLSLAHCSWAAIKTSLFSGLSFHGANLTLFAATEFDKLLALQLLDDRRIGYFAVAASISSLGGGLVAQSIGIIVSREMAVSSGVQEQARVLVRNMQLAVPVLLVVNGAAALLAPWWIPTLFGNEFAAAVPVMAILLLAGSLKSIRQLLDRAMRGVRISRIGAIGETVALISLALVGWPSVAYAGLEGLSWAIVFAQVCSLLVTVRMIVGVLELPSGDFCALHREGLLSLRRAVGFRFDSATRRFRCR